MSWTATMLLLLALAAASAANQTGVAEWKGGEGNWSDPLMWRGELPDSDSVQEVHLCAWRRSQIVVGPAGGRSQPTVVLCEGLLLDIAGRVSIAPITAALPPPPQAEPPQAPPSAPAPSEPGGGIWAVLPLPVWIAVVGGGSAGILLLVVILVCLLRMCCCSSRPRKNPRSAKEQVQPQPDPARATAEDEEWPSNTPSFKNSQRWSGIL